MVPSWKLALAEEYTLTMRRSLAIGLLVITTLVVLADPIACPDGCSSSSGQTSSQVSPYDVDVCVWCLGVSVGFATPSVSATLIVSETAELVPPVPLLGSLSSIEHPPRKLSF